jgi:predicted Fe-Mo cluster-binding NifX family protein
MKICFTTGKKNGLNSKIYNHFGSAPFFIIVDKDSESFEEIDNGNLHHEHGQCNPLLALLGNKIDIVIVGGIGEGAKVKLATEKIDVYQAEKGSVKDNLKLFKEGKLTKMKVEDLCNAHGCGDHDHSHNHQHSIIRGKA